MFDRVVILIKYIWSCMKTVAVGLCDIELISETRLIDVKCYNTSAALGLYIVS